jgi:hypothetical protein
MRMTVEIEVGEICDHFISAPEETSPGFAAFDIEAAVPRYCEQCADRAPPARGKGIFPPVCFELRACVHLLSA